MILRPHIRKALKLSLYLLLVAGFSASAVRIALAQRHERMASVDARAQMQEWHRQLGDELPVNQREAWRETADLGPELMLRACSRERVGHD